MYYVLAVAVGYGVAVECFGFRGGGGVFGCLGGSVVGYRLLFGEGEGYWVAVIGYFFDVDVGAVVVGAVATHDLVVFDEFVEGFDGVD